VIPPKKFIHQENHRREENTSERSPLQSQSYWHPLAVAFFKHQSCYQFCEMVERVKYNHEPTRLFVLHLHNGQVNLASVTFTLTPKTIAKATGIPNVDE